MKVDSRGVLLAVGALVCNAFIWGVSWWPFRELQSHGLHPLWATALVYALMLAVLLALYPRSWRGFIAQPQLWLLLIAAGLANTCFNWAVTVGDVVRVVLLFYLMPAWSVLVAWVMLGEKPSVASLLRLVMAMAGVLIVLKTPDSPWPLPQSLADWMGLLGGFCFAITNAFLRKLNTAPSDSRMLAMFAGGAILSAGTALAGMSQHAVPAPALAAAGIPVALGLAVAFMVSNAALQYGAARLAASTTSLVMLTELLFASVSAGLLGASTFSIQLMVGGSLIVLAALLAALGPASAVQANDRATPH
ncbi:MAG: DMT family transporter [Pseudomonadota bacterium]